MTLAATLAATLALACGPALAADAPVARPDDTDARGAREKTTIPPAPGVPHFAWLDAFEGLPADTLGGIEVLSGFRGAFASLMLPTQVVKGEYDATQMSVPLSNRFRLVEGTTGAGAWRLQVAIRPEGRFAGGAADGRDSTDMRLVVFQIIAAAIPPDADPEVARPVPSRVRVSFPEPRNADEALALYDVIGRTIGLFALEDLHHRAGELDTDVEIRFGDRVFRGPVP